jgi:murein DD-endopeptidase MepM/ murein hydrolase activator NlpD/uncharacterized protein YbaA (DUF1428 family)
MPMVPETFAPSVSQGDTPLTPATGPWVSPMRNHAPSLLQQTGSTLMQAGDTAARLGNTIGDRVQETMDDGLTKQAETQFLKGSQDVLLNPQGGYMFSRGLDAQTQWDPATKAIAKARQDARATLTSPVQQKMFDQVTNDHMLTLGRTMADHQHGEVTQFGIQQSQDRADSMNILASAAYRSGRMDDYQKYSGQARDEVMHVAGLNGAAPDSDIAQAMLRAKHTDLVHGITVGLLDDHKYDQAKQFFEGEKSNIDMRASESLGNAVKTEWDRNLIETKGDALLAGAQTGGTVPHTYGPLATGSTINPMRITDVPGSPRPGGRLHDGYDIAMPAGTQVQAPLDGKVVKVWNDEQYGGGLSMRVQLADGNTLGVAHLSAANLKEGDTVNRGQVIALSGNSGNATGNVLHVALTDPDGQKIDYFGASKAQPDQANVADPNVLQRAIDSAKADSSLDPYQQKQVVRYMEMQHTKERTIQAQQYQEVKKQATDWWFQHGNSIADLPASVKMQLSPEDLDSFSQQAKVKNDVDLMANWIEHPEQQTVDAVRQAYAQGRLSDNGYLRSLNGAMAIQDDASKVNPEKVRAVTVDNDQINNTLIQNGFQNLATPATKDPDAKAQKVKLVQNIKDQIDAAQTAGKRALTRQDKQEIIDRTISDSAFVDQTHFFGAPTAAAKRVYFMTPKEMANAYELVGNEKVYLRDIQPQERQSIIGALNRRGMPVTQQTIANLWVQAGKPGSK